MTTTSTTYGSFAKILSSYQQQYAQPQAGPSKQLDSPLQYDVVLDEEGGLIHSLESAIEETIRSKTSSGGLEPAGDDQISGEEYEALKLEHRTWQLIRAVYDHHLHRSDPSFVASSAKDQLLQNPYITPEDITQYIIDEDSDLSLWATLIDHLQTRPLMTSPPPLEARHGYLPSTLRQQRNKATKSLDPDFTLRDPHGPGLAGEDQAYQLPLLETLFNLVRYGEMNEAVATCERGGEPWRGATLMGGRRWGMGGMTRDSTGITAMEGNRSRELWKKACRAIAKNPTLSASERHLYAALISDLPTLLPACDSWEDELWAHIQHRLENRLSQRWHELGGFWENQARSWGEDGDVELGGGGLDEVFDAVGRGGKEKVVQMARDPYHVAQKFVVLGKTETLLNQFADRIEGLEHSVSPALVPHLIRFFAHLVLVLRSLSQPVPDLASNTIIQAYLKVLEAEGNDGLVAMYAGCLREGNGEESYARFLRAMDPNATREARMTALNRAQQYNLDIAVIAKETVRMVLAEAFSQTIPALSASQPDITGYRTGLSERDVYLIRSIEWLTMIPETIGEALRKSNDVARYFLALGQASAAQALLKTLPSDLEVFQDEEEEDDFDLLEHEQFRHLFKVFACHELVLEVQGKVPKQTATKVEHHNWRKSLSVSLRPWVARLELTTACGADGDRTDECGHDRAAVRGLAAIPRLVEIHEWIAKKERAETDQTDLHTGSGPAVAFAAHRQHDPLPRQALDLTKLVMTEDLHVYEEFFDRENNPFKLITFLERVKSTSMMILQTGSQSPFVLA
ncbi:hypothetical protein P7C73_g4306, partial [Tremellales sp. Uapishka_1]